jgi:HK97 family phage portal protein
MADGHESDRPGARESGHGLGRAGLRCALLRQRRQADRGWIEFPGSFKDSEAKKVFRESYQAAQSGENRGKVLVLENGMKFHEVGVTNRDAQFLELRKFQITDIARLFRVPPHMIADLDRATFSNIEQQSLEFVMHTMTPWAERWEASIEAELLFDGDDLEVEFDFANLMRGDAASRSSYYQSGIQNGWLTRNEARIAENLNPLDGLDEPLRPLNLVEEGSAGDRAGDGEQGKPPEETAQPMDE